jgi:hypothetical protein
MPVVMISAYRVGSVSAETYCENFHDSVSAETRRRGVTAIRHGRSARWLGLVPLRRPGLPAASLKRMIYFIYA